MLRVCEILREVDYKRKRLGLVSTETDYLYALQDAMANMNRLVQVEVLKSLGDVNLEKGRLDKNPEKFDRAMVLYRTALLQCEDEEVGESLANRCRYAAKLRLGRVTRNPLAHLDPLSHGLNTNDREMSSPVKMAEKFLLLERDCKKKSVLIEYTKLMVEGIINGDSMLQVEAIKSIGDAYLKRGTETRDAPCLTKATALYNTALSRCVETQGRVAVIHRLLYTARIRQNMGKTGNKGTLKDRQGQQHKDHLSRNVPVTPPNTDVIRAANTDGQESMSYEEYVTTGDRALADRKLDLAERKFAAALKLIHDPNKPDRRKEAECLCRLGDVYLQCGQRTKEGRKFTQAAALYNAAMARTDKRKDSVMVRLQETEECLLRCTANVDSKSIPTDETIHHKKRLEDIRSRAKTQLEAIDQQHNPYQYDEDDPKMKKVEAERAEAVKALFKTIANNRQTFIHVLVDECIETLGPPPCKYAFIGLGSQATELVTPYSDLEFAILIEDGKDNDDTRRYFINLTHYLHLKVINLGETILPAMAIVSLNDFQSEDPNKDWFFDSVTPRGFAFDGFMPWASKTPFGRDKTKMKPRVSLVQTPTKMAEFQHLDISVSEGYHLSDILRRYVFLVGEEALVNEYEEEISKIITDGLLSNVTSRLSAVQILYENIDQFSNHEPTGELLNVKKDIYRFPGIAIELLALCCQITLSSAWDVIDRLKEMGKIGEENATHLTVLTSISAELRLRTYMANGGQKDSLSPLLEMKYQAETREVPDSVLRSVFYVPDTKALFGYYCRAIPLKKCIPNTVQFGVEATSRRVFKTTIFDDSNECLGRIANNLHLSETSKYHWEAALSKVGSDTIKRSLIYSELGGYWGSHGNFTKAKHYFEQSLRIRQDFYGDNVAHLDTAKSLLNLGILWYSLGDQKKAISYYEQSLTMTKTICGNKAEHPVIAGTLLKLGKSWNRLGDQKKAMRHFEQSLTMSKTIYGENTAHYDIAMSLHYLGNSSFKLGDQKKALLHFEQSLTMMKTLYGHNTAHPDIAESLINLGSYWSKLGDQKKAIGYYEQSLTMTKTIYGDNKLQSVIAVVLHNLGGSWIKLGDQEKAISYFEQSLTMTKSLYGNMPHPDIAASLHNLGSSFSKLGDQKKAISYTEQSLTMMKSLYGDMPHPDIAGALGNLGSCWSELGDQRKASGYYEQSLTMLKIVYGHNTLHPDIAILLNKLGSFWSKLGDPKTAISYYEKSLTMTKSIYGNNTAHPDIAGLFHNLGSSWIKLGAQKKAISYTEQSLTMRKSLYGDMPHPDIAVSLNNLGSLWRELGDQKKAIGYFEESLTMAKAIYGDNTAHSAIAGALHNLGSSWSKLGDHKKAIDYYEGSLTMLKTIHGDKAHTDISLVLQSLGVSLSVLDNQKKAMSYFEEALAMNKSIYGDNTAHPAVAASIENLGSSWNTLGDQKKAIHYYMQSLAMKKAIYGDNKAHPDITGSLGNLGSAWSTLGNERKAISFFKQSLTMMKAIYGDNMAHPDIALALHNLGFSWSKLGDQDKAINFHEQSLAMMKIVYGDNTVHLNIADSLQCLGLSWSRLGNEKKAISYFEQSLTMKKTIYGHNTAHPGIAELLQNLVVSWSILGDDKRASEYSKEAKIMSQALKGWKFPKSAFG